jgi:hypothetical protein
MSRQATTRALVSRGAAVCSSNPPQLTKWGWGGEASHRLASLKTTEKWNRTSNAPGVQGCRIEVSARWIEICKVNNLYLQKREMRRCTASYPDMNSDRANSTYDSEQNKYHL